MRLSDYDDLEQLSEKHDCNNNGLGNEMTSVHNDTSRSDSFNEKQYFSVGCQTENYLHDSNQESVSESKESSYETISNETSYRKPLDKINDRETITKRTNGCFQGFKLFCAKNKIELSQGISSILF